MHWLQRKKPELISMDRSWKNETWPSKRSKKNWTLFTVFPDFFRTVHVHKVFEGLYEVSWSTECNDEETCFVLSTILEKIRKKTVKRVTFCWTFLTVKSHFFKNGLSKWVLVFCVAISASRCFIWAIKRHYPMIFNFHFSKEGPFWFRGGLSATRRGWTGQKPFSKCFSWTLWHSQCI